MRTSENNEVWIELCKVVVSGQDRTERYVAETFKTSSNRNKLIDGVNCYVRENDEQKRDHSQD